MAPWQPEVVVRQPLMPLLCPHAVRIATHQREVLRVIKKLLRLGSEHVIKCRGQR